MDSTIETLEGDQVRLSVAVTADEFEEAVEAAFVRIAKDLRLPGFRPGKAPRRVVEARVGTIAGRREALEHSLPSYYSQALISNEVDAIGRPEIEITGGVEGGEVTFNALVAVRPRPSVSGHRDLRVEVPVIEPTEDEINEQLDALRSQLATLEPTDHPATEGDMVTIDIAGTRDGEPVPGLTASDYLYEIGGGGIVPEVDEHLLGASVDETFEFDALDPDSGDSLSFVIAVKGVQIRRLPELDDEFAAEVSEFQTITDLVSDTSSRLQEAKQQQIGMLARDRIARAVADLIEIEAPEDLIESEIDERIHNLDQRLRSQGLELDRYLEAVGQDLEVLREEFREAAEIGVRVDLGLRSVAHVEYLDDDSERLDNYLQIIATQSDLDVDEVRDRLVSSGGMLNLKGDIDKQAAMDWLLDNVEVVDEDGNVIDRTLLEPPAPVIPDGVVDMGENGVVDAEEDIDSDKQFESEEEAK